VNKDIPCENCILVSVCRFRDYREMLRKCVLLREQLYYHGRVSKMNRKEDFTEIINVAEKYIKPVKWKSVPIRYSYDSDKFEASIRPINKVKVVLI